MRMLLHWVLSGLAVWIVAQVVPGFDVSGPVAALIAALVIGIVNATIGLVLKILTFPLTLVTLGLFWLVINALMLLLTSHLSHRFGYDFSVDGFVPALVGSVVISLVSWLLSVVLVDDGDDRR